MDVARLKICRVVTVPFCAYGLMRSQLEKTAECGHDVHLVCTPDAHWRYLEAIRGITLHPLLIKRPIAPVHDAAALWRLYWFFRGMNFDIVHSVTPKAGLLSAIAGGWAGVPIRLHTFTGQPWVELSGWKRQVTRLADKIIATRNTRVFADSASQIDFLTKEGICDAERISLIGAGSLSGVDCDRFNAAKWRPRVSEIKAGLGIPEAAKVIVFVGRITRDKGVAELVAAFEQVRQQMGEVYLVMAGPVESVTEAFSRTVAGHPFMRLPGFSPEPERYLAIADVFCLPSYREGFGLSVIEAAAMGVPAVASRVVGLVDAVVDGNTGILVPPKDAQSLAQALVKLLQDDTLRRQLGMAAAQRAAEVFDQNVINGAMVDEYRRLARVLQD